MGNKQTTKTDQKQTQDFNQEATNKVDWAMMPNTPDQDAFRNMQFKIDPSIGFRAGDEIRRMESSYSNPLGKFTGPTAQGAMNTERRRINEEVGAQAQKGAYDVGNQQAAQRQFMAGLTAPQLYQSGGTQKGTQAATSAGTSVSSSPWYNTVVNGAISMGSAALL